MRKVSKWIRKNVILIIGIIIGVVIFGGSVYAAEVYSKDITYNNSNSGLSSTNLQGAIDELYKKTEELTPIPSIQSVTEAEYNTGFYGCCNSNACGSDYVGPIAATVVISAPDKNNNPLGYRQSTDNSTIKYKIGNNTEKEVKTFENTDLSSGFYQSVTVEIYPTCEEVLNGGEIYVIVPENTFTSGARYNDETILDTGINWVKPTS